MKKTSKKPRLEMKREVIRVLTAEQLAGVAGGQTNIPTGNSETCTCNSTKAQTC